MGLAKKDAPLVRLEMEAVATFDADQLKITSVDLNVRGEVPGMSDEESRPQLTRPIRGAPSPTP